MKKLLAISMLSFVTACGPSTSPEIVQSPSALPSPACGRIATLEFLNKGGETEINARVKPAGSESCVYGEALDSRKVPLKTGALLLVTCIESDTYELLAKEVETGAGPFFLTPDSQTSIPENLPPCTDAHYRQ